MYKYIIAIILTLSLCLSADAQVYKPFTEKDLASKQGEYFVLVTAKWCAPCKTLKEKLTAFPEQVIYVVDYDENPDLAIKMSGGNVSLPMFIKYQADGINRSRRDYSKGEALSSFLAKSAPAQVPAKEPAVEPIKTPLLSKDDLNFQGPLDKLAEKLEERLASNQSKMDEILTAIRDKREERASNEPELSLLRGLRDSIRGFEGFIKRLQEASDKSAQDNATMRGVFSKLADRIDSRVDALSGSNERLFSQVKDLIQTQQELRKDSREVFAGLRDLIDRGKRSETDIAEIKADIKRRPGQAFLTRIDEFFALLTENILKFFMYLLVIILAAGFLLAIVLMIAAAFVKLLKKLLSKVTFGVFE